jgi:Flp pilus assembly protein TadG
VKPVSSHSRRAARRGDEGIALIYVALFLLATMWFVSMVIDVGKLMAARTELQAAADAAALAGASALDPVTKEIDPTLAKARASATASSNSAYENGKTAVVITPDTDVEFPAVRQVKVSVYRDAAHANPVMLYFAQTIDPTLKWMGVHADATAEVGPLSGVCEGLAPFAPEDQPGGFSKDCGTSYTLKLGAGNSTSGNFQLLDYPDCAENDTSFVGGGSAAIRYYIINGYDCCLKIGELITVDTKPGNSVGPVKQGLQARWDADTDKRPGICYQDYTGNQSRVFLTPIIRDFDVNGKKQVEIVRFAAFFLKDPPNGNFVQGGITGQFIDYVAPGIVGGVPPSATDVFGIHLIE